MHSRKRSQSSEIVSDVEGLPPPASTRGVGRRSTRAASLSFPVDLPQQAAAAAHTLYWFQSGILLLLGIAFCTPVVIQAVILSPRYHALCNAFPLCAFMTPGSYFDAIIPYTYLDVADKILDAIRRMLPLIVIVLLLWAMVSKIIQQWRHLAISHIWYILSGVVWRWSWSGMTGVVIMTLIPAGQWAGHQAILCWGRSAEQAKRAHRWWTVAWLCLWIVCALRCHGCPLLTPPPSHHTDVNPALLHRCSHLGSDSSLSMTLCGHMSRPLPGLLPSTSQQ